MGKPTDTRSSTNKVRVVTRAGAPRLPPPAAKVLLRILLKASERAVEDRARRAG